MNDNSKNYRDVDPKDDIPEGHWIKSVPNFQPSGDTEKTTSQPQSNSFQCDDLNKRTIGSGALIVILVAASVVSFVVSAFLFVVGYGVLEVFASYCIGAFCLTTLGIIVMWFRCS